MEEAEGWLGGFRNTQKKPKRILNMQSCQHGRGGWLSWSGLSPEELVCQSQAEMPDPLHQNSRGRKGSTANASVTVQRSPQTSLVEARKNCLSLSHSPGNIRFHSMHTVRSPSCTKLGNTRCPPTHPQVYCNILNFRLQPSREDTLTA